MNNLETILSELKDNLNLYITQYQADLALFEQLGADLDDTAARIKRAQKAILALTGEDNPGEGGERATSPVASAEPGDRAAQVADVPATPRLLLATCPACGAPSLVPTQIRTTNGRLINALQCQDSSCNSQYPS